MPRLFVGLGNPGPRYKKSRHNLGWLVIDRLAARLDVSWGKHQKWESGFFLHEAQKIWLLKPLTYMNLSGEAVAPFARPKGIPPDQIVVIHDELALPLGQLRLKTQGGAGGHNGLTSVIMSLGSESFTRLRLGVGAAPPGIDLASYVLANFLAEEEPLVKEMVEKAADLCLLLLREGTSKTMTNLNNRKRSA